MRMRSAYTAGTVPLPGKPIPRASVRQFIEFAVNMPAQEPQPGQALSSIRASSLASILPAFRAPTASNTLLRSRLRPPSSSDSMGPPEMKMEGRFSLAAAISMPGMILSQLGIKTSASKQCARTMHSTLSAMSSRVHSEYFIPSCPIAMPSQTPMVLNSSGVPPAASTPSLTARAI